MDIFESSENKRILSTMDEIMEAWDEIMEAWDEIMEAAMDN